MAIGQPPTVDYTIDVQTPFQAAVQGLQFAAGRETLEAARTQRDVEAQARQTALAQQQQFQTGLNTFFKKPPAERNFDELSQLMIGANKQQFDALKNIGDTMSTERKEASQKFVAQGLLALEAKPELFQTMVTERISAETDPNQKRALETVQQIAQTDPKRAGILLEELGAATFGKTWYEGITSARTERRAEAKGPSELKEQQAKARKALQEAINTEATAPDDVAKAKAAREKEEAEAKLKAIEAEFAREKAETAAKQAAATLRKTEADILIDKENARIAALNAAAAKETNNLKRQELQQKIDDAKEKRDALDRDQKATVSNQSADIDNFLNTAQRVLNTPEDVIKSATGPVASRLPTLSSDVSDFEALVEALGSQAFIAQIPKIKGTGSLSEKEGDKLQASLQTLSLKQSPARLKENVTEAVRLLTKVRENIALKYGVQAPPLDVPSALQVSVQLPNGQTAKFPNQAAADAFKKKAGIQ